VRPPGGGFPVGAFGGRKDIMDKVVTPVEPSKVKAAVFEEKRMFQSGTFSGNPITTETAAAFRLGWVANGIYIPGVHTVFTSAAHTDADIDKILEVSEEILREIKTSGLSR